MAREERLKELELEYEEFVNTDSCIRLEEKDKYVSNILYGKNATSVSAKTHDSKKSKRRGKRSSYGSFRS